MSVEDAIDATIQAAHGLAYAHSLNIVHRDVKPHNLLLTRSAGDFVVDAAGMPASGSDRPDRFVIKVLDLGLARIDVPLDARTPASLTNTAAMTHSGMIMGTVEYMAPEQAADARLADHRSDVYALGCTLFYLLTGRHPFTGENFLDVLLAHRLQLLASLVTLRAEVPVELDLAFQRMTAKNPADRFQSMDELIVDLQHVLAAMRCGAPTRPSVCATESDDLQAANAETATMVRQVRAPLASRFASRSWRVATAVAVLAACGLGAAIWVGTHNRSHVTPGREPRLGRPPDLVGPFSSEQAARIQLAWSEYLGMPVVDSDRTGMRFALIPPGEFIMGSELDALDRWLNDPDNAQWVEQTRSESPARSVKITRPFYLGVTEVTVGQFRVFARATHHRTDAERSAGWGLSDGQWRLRSEFNWENLGDQPTTDHHPAVSISWNDATEYCRWLSERTKSSCGLPTEAQWEWACRAGSNEIWPSGSDATRLGEHAWFAGNSENLMHTVAQKLPNGFGLFDMVGNEWEWCDDYYSADVNRTSLTDDPHGSASGEFRVQRGGSAFDAAARVRMTVRGGSDPASPTRGAFRVVRVIDQ
jgi:serine/threonine-protein kinase